MLDGVQLNHGIIAIDSDGHYLIGPQTGWLFHSMSTILFNQRGEDILSVVVWRRYQLYNNVMSIVVLRLFHANNILLVIVWRRYQFDDNAVSIVVLRLFHSNDHSCCQ